MLLQNLIPAMEFTSHASSKPTDCRFFLQSIVFQVENETTIKVTGCDGHRVATCLVLGEHSLPAGEYILPGDQVKALIKSFKPKKSDSDILIELSFDGDVVQFATGTGMAMTIRPMDAKYPDFERALTSDHKCAKGPDGKKPDMGINVAYLMEGGKAAKLIANPTYHGGKLSHRDNGMLVLEIPSLLEIDNAALHIMPMKL